MPWANLDDAFPSHPKALPLSDAAFRLHVSGICYAAKHKTDGVIHGDAVALLAPRFKKAVLDELLRRALWHDLGDGCGTDTCPIGVPESYVIHDFLEWNQSREQVEAIRERKRAAGRKGAANRWH